eukprot:622724-Pyramimonas_sp.AAC.1
MSMDIDPETGNRAPASIARPPPYADGKITVRNIAKAEQTWKDPQGGKSWCKLAFQGKTAETV